MEYLSRFNGNAGAQLAKIGKSHLAARTRQEAKGTPPTLNLYLALHVFIKIDFHNK